MKYLLDTCVISELVRKDPDLHVVEWIDSCPEEDLFLSTLTIGELCKGIAKLPLSAKKEQLLRWVEFDLIDRFADRIVDIDLDTAKIWGKIQADAEQKGKAMPAIDSLIAATGLARDLVIVTRNSKDMEHSGVSLFNPWKRYE
jgi:predicted nucleic acid-binding protein